MKEIRGERTRREISWIIFIANSVQRCCEVRDNYQGRKEAIGGIQGRERYVFLFTSSSPSYVGEVSGLTETQQALEVN